MAWFQIGSEYGRRSQGGSALEDRKMNNAEDRSVLGELNSQQPLLRQQNLKEHVRLHGQENAASYLKQKVLQTKPAQSHRQRSRSESQQLARHEAQQASQQGTNPTAVQNIDKDELDPLACADLANDIMGNLFLAENSKLPSPDYMEMRQPDITPEMRSILIDWLVEVAQEYRLQQETLHLCVRLIDAFLSRAPVQRNKLQLVGVSCMFIASKFEEIYAPQVDDFSFITEETYSKAEIIAFERIVLLTLDFELNLPTMRLFLSRFLKAALADIPPSMHDGRLEALSSYIAELSLLEYASLRAPPSMIAASSVLLAQWCLYNAPWSNTLAHYSTYTAPDLRHIVRFLYVLYSKARSNELPAVREKYSHPRYLCVAALNPPCNLPESLFLPQDVL